MKRETNKPDPNQVFDESITNIGQLFEEQHNHQTIVIGKIFGRYEIQEELGRGGMGIVYKALDTQQNMLVALKIIMIEENSQSIERFKREASTIAKLDHPNIIRFYDVGDSPKPYFTMEYVEGQTLAHFIKERKIKPLQLVDIMIKICDALYHAHKKKILHRDLKPSNIMLTRGGIPKIMDFGVAKITEATMQTLSKSGEVLGTMLYMAPEQVDGKATHKSDIYSIGATIYEGLTYKTVFQGDGYFNLVYQMIQENPIPPREINPNISPYLEAICLKCIHKNSRKRYDDFKQLSRELKNFKNRKPIIAKKYTSWDVFKNFVDKHKIICTGIALIFVILSVSLGITVNTLAYANQQRDKANRALKIAENALLAKEQSNKKLIIEKKKTDEANKGLTALNKAIIKSLEYARTTDNGEYKNLFIDKEFLTPVRKVFQQSIKLQTAQEYTFLRGVILGQSQKKQDILQAIDDCTTEIHKNPKNATAYLNRGVFYHKQRKYNLAEKDFNKALQLNPKYSDVYYNRGVLYKSQGKYNLAERNYNKAIQLNPREARAYYNRGNLYKTQGKHNLAKRDYNIAIDLSPKYADAYVNRGSLYKSQGMHKQAHRDYNKALQLNPKDADIYCNRGNLYIRQGKYNLAKRDYDTAIDLNPKFVSAYMKRGALYKNQGKYRQAERDYNKAIDLDPKNVEAYNNRGDVYHKQGKYNLAERDYNKAIQLNPKYADLYYNRGNLYYEQGKHKQTERDYNKAIDLDPKFTNAYYNRGVLHKNQGRHNLAILDWEKAISLGIPRAKLQSQINKAKQFMQKQK